MTMTPDELRALADALQRMADDDSGIPQWERDTTSRAADYLRAQADAQPVRAVPIGHALSAVRHVGSANYPDRERAAIERLYHAEFDAYTHPAPAAPQASEDANVWKQIIPDDAPQAEPKREPLSDEQIDAALQTDHVLAARLMIGGMTLTQFRDAIRKLTRTVERAHGIGGSDE